MNHRFGIPFVLFALAGLTFVEAKIAIAAPTRQQVEAIINEKGSSSSATYKKKYNEVLGKIKSGEWTSAKETKFQLGNSAAAAYRTSDAMYLKNEIRACNSSDGIYSGRHSFSDLTRPPLVLFIPTAPNCKLMIRYIGSGRTVGTCLRIIPFVWPCKTLWITADLIEYLWPTHKISTSDQMMQSRFLESGAVAPVVAQLLAHFETEAQKVQVPKVIELVQQQRMMPDIPEQSVAAGSAKIMHQPAWWAWLRSYNGYRGYSRHFNEPFFILNSYFVPHVPAAEPFYATDFDFRLSNWLPSSAQISSSYYYEHLRSPQDCLLNNMATGKTPGNLLNNLPGWTARRTFEDPKNLEFWRCLDRVGEVSPYTAQQRRPANSDGFLQTVVKGLKIYSTKFPVGVRHKLRLDVDMFHLPAARDGDPPLLNSKLTADLGLKASKKSCNFLKDLVKENHQYKTTNSIDGATGNEASLEVFTRFRGCYGIKGPLNYFFNRIGTRPTRFHRSELRLE